MFALTNREPEASQDRAESEQRPKPRQNPQSPKQSKLRKTFLNMFTLKF